MFKSVTFFISGFVVIALMSGAGMNVKAQTLASPVENISELPLAASADQKPTPEQVKNGRALLAKILNVLETIPLMDSDGVMRALGVQDIGYSAYPSHIYVSQKNPEVPTEIGLTRVYMLPWQRNDWSANLGGTFDSSVCLQKMDIDMALGLPYKAAPIVLIDQVAVDKNFVPTYYSYLVEVTPFSEFSIEMDFSFYSKYCADRFGSGYSKKR